MKIPYGKQFIDKNDFKCSKRFKKNLITQGPLIEKFEKFKSVKL